MNKFQQSSFSLAKPTQFYSVMKDKVMAQDVFFIHMSFGKQEFDLGVLLAFS